MPKADPLDVRYPKRMLQREMAQALRIKTATIRAWTTCPRNADGTYDLYDVIQWRQEQQPARTAKSEQPIPLDGEDALMASGEATPALERWRAARAQQEEIRLEQMKREVIPVAMVREALGRVGAVLRNAGDRLQRVCGREAFDLYVEGLDEAEANIEQWLEESKDG